MNKLQLTGLQVKLSKRAASEWLENISVQYFDVVSLETQVFQAWKNWSRTFSTHA